MSTRTIEAVFESPVGPTGEQPRKRCGQATRVTDPSDEKIHSARTSFANIAADLRSWAMKFGIGAKPSELLSESGELSRLGTTATEKRSENPARMEEIVPTPPVNRPRATAVSNPQPSGTMHSSVKLIFSFEIAAAQLTPTFNIGVLQVRPRCKIVTMRLAPSQQSELEVNFDIAKIQPAGKTFGTIRLTPSQQQTPILGSPSFTTAGLQLVPNPQSTRVVQLMPSQQAVVFVTVPCQMITVELSPLLELASIVLNSSSKHALVQLAGAASSAADRPLIFEIADLQLREDGNAGMIQLNRIGRKPMGNYETTLPGSQRDHLI